MSVVNQIVLRQRPIGVPTTDDFSSSQAELPALSSGELLVRVKYLSLDPYIRSVIAGRHISAPIGPGDVIPGEGVAEVVESARDGYQRGDRVAVMCGWRDMAVVAADATARKISDAIDPPSLALGLFGMPGLTAWIGFNQLSEARRGDRFVVSSASGSVGSLVGQLARRAGCHTIGTAGSVDKCAWVTNQARLDACINYRAEDLRVALKRECPDGIDVYFDNVGGDTLQAVMEQLSVGARVVLCGLISQYNHPDSPPPPGPNPGLIIRARATVRGLVVYDHFSRMDEMVADLLPAWRDGDIAWREDVSVGLPNAPAAFARLMRGENNGKMIVRL